MTNKKAFLSALSLSVITGALVVAAPLSAQAAVDSFSDVPTTLDHHNSIMNLAERGIITGFKDGSFKPDSQLTRAHASKILALSLNLDVKNVKDPGFKDLNSKQWFYPYVAALANKGIISGFEDDTFRPNAPMTRAHMSKVIDLGYTFEKTADVANPFTDVKSNAWYLNHVTSLVENKVTKGKTATTFAPNAFVTRAQMASFVVRAENSTKVKELVANAKTEIRKIVTENGVIEVQGKKVAEANYDLATNTLTMTAYNVDEGVKALSGLGIFSTKLDTLGVTDIQVGNGKKVNLLKDRAAAKASLMKQMQDMLALTPGSSAGDLSVKNVPITIYAELDGVEFWETFKVNVGVFVSK